MEPSQATEHALRRILKYYPQFQGALVAANKTGSFGMFFIHCCSVCGTLKGKYFFSKEEKKHKLSLKFVKYDSFYPILSVLPKSIITARFSSKKFIFIFFNLLLFWFRVLFLSKF